MNRASLLVLILAAGVVAALRAGQPPRPERPMQVEKVKENLYVLRGPFHKCAPNGCGAYADDGFLHEAGDVAVRVTPEGLIVVDDKYQENAAEVLAAIKSISTLPIKYLLNTHHHTDHAGADESFIKKRMAALARRQVPLDQVFDGLKLADLGWDRTVSTVAFKGGLKGLLRRDEGGQVSSCL